MKVQPEGYAKGQAVVVQRPGQNPITGTVDHIHTAPGYVAVRDDRHRSVSNYPTSFVSPVSTEEEPEEWATSHSGFTAHRFQDRRALCRRDIVPNEYVMDHDAYSTRTWVVESSLTLCHRCDAKQDVQISGRGVNDDPRLMPPWH